MPLGVPFNVNTDLTLYFDLDADLQAFTDGVALGTVAEAADTGAAYIWNGSTWKSLGGATTFSGNGAPDASLGSNGDIYIDFDTGNLYEKVSGVWVVQGDISPTIPPDSWLYGTTTAATATGNASNFYSEYVNNRVYQKTNTTATIAASNLVAESTSATSGVSSYQTVSAVSAVSGRLYLAYVWAVGNATTVDSGAIASITGGPNWSLVKTVSHPSSLGWARCSVYSAMSTSSLAGATLGIAASPPPSGGDVVVIAAQVQELTGTDTSGTDGSGAIVQSQSNTTGVAVFSLAASLNAFADSANNAVVAGYWHGAAEATNPDSGFTELADITAASTFTERSGFETSWRLGQDTSPTGSWATSRVALTIAVEIAANVTGSTWTRLVPGLKVYHSNFSIASSSAQTTIFTQSIPGGLLETTSSILILLDGLYTNNTGSTKGLGMTISFGGANVWGDTTVSTFFASNANARPVVLHATMANETSSTSRKLAGNIMVGSINAGSVAGFGTITNAPTVAAIGGTSTVDTSSAQTLALTATLSSAAATLTFAGAVTVIVIP